LGRSGEASREADRFLNSIRSAWFGKSPPTDRAIAAWLLNAHPIRHDKDWKHLRDGVHGAGVDVGGIERA
jgi:hypothetical protein